MRVSFCGLLSGIKCKQNVQILASNGSVTEAHNLEYRTSGRLTLICTVCIDDPIDNAEGVTSNNYDRGLPPEF